MATKKAKAEVAVVEEVVADDLVAALDSALENGDVETAVETETAAAPTNAVPVQYAPYPEGLTHIQVLFPNKAMFGDYLARDYGAAGNVKATYNPDKGYVQWPMAEKVVYSQAGTERAYTPAWATVSPEGVVVTPLDSNVPPTTVEGGPVAVLLMVLINDMPSLRWPEDAIPWRWTDEEVSADEDDDEDDEEETSDDEDDEEEDWL